MFCQLETLRYCLPPSVRRTLDESPESLDETYERVLREIKRPNRDHALRLLQCLVVAIRPLEVEELAEVLAVDFDDTEGIAKLRPDWRWEDEEQALLTSCSSLITTVETGYSRVVQFSHFSVKEYLTSDRLATSSGGVSRYHIDLEPAHTILAQACIGVLLQPRDGVENDDDDESSPLDGYAAQYWVTHTQFERVSSFLRKEMECLFDLDNPYFAAWVESYDIDTLPEREWSSLSLVVVDEKSSATPLYYAALCGFEDLVKHLVVKFPGQLDSNGGHYVTPLVAALAGRHFRTATFLQGKGARVHVRSDNGITPLDSAALRGDLEMVRVLLDYKEDVNVRDDGGWTPLHSVSQVSRIRVPPFNFPQLWLEVARLLIEHGADVNAQKDDGQVSLHLVGTAGVFHLLLEHGANVGAVDNEGRTLLHSEAGYGTTEVVRVLLELGANAGAVDNEGRTPLHSAANDGVVGVVRMLLEHGANVGAVDNEGKTPLHLAAFDETVEVVHLLLEHGANVGAVDNEGGIPLHSAAINGTVEIVRVLLEHGANAGAVDNEGRTPLHAAAINWAYEAIPLLLEHGANIGAVDNKGRTPLLNAVDNGDRRYLRVEFVSVLLEHGANVGAEDNEGRTPFQIASANKDDRSVMELLSEHGAEGML